jgi:hypothetical protein
VYLKVSKNIGNRTIVIPWKKRYPLLSIPKTVKRHYRYSGKVIKGNFIRRWAVLLKARLRHLRKRVDFCLGPSEVAKAIMEKRQCRLSSKYCLHNTEIVLAIHNAGKNDYEYRIKTTFDPIDPMDWAKP